MEGHLAHKKPVPLTSKDSHVEWVEKENWGELANWV